MDALKGEFLHYQYSSNDVLIQYQFEEEKEFQAAHKLATHTWNRGDLSLGPSGHRRSESPSPRGVVGNTAQ
jgi:hypothetical protein